MQRAFLESPDCLEFLASRGISVNIAKHLRWGFKSSCVFDSKMTAPALVIPLYRDTQVVGVSFRPLDGRKKFTSLHGSSTDGLCGLSQLDPTQKEVVIVEGALNLALALSHGFNAVAFNSGSELLPDNIKALSPFDRI